MGFQSERSQRSTSSFWHGTSHWAKWFPTTTDCKCFHGGLPKGTAWSPQETGHRVIQHSWLKLKRVYSEHFRTKFWTMPPLFCLFTFAVIALRYRTHTAETWSRHQAWHLDQLISHMDNLSANVLISKRRDRKSRKKAWLQRGHHMGAALWRSNVVHEGHLRSKHLTAKDATVDVVPCLLKLSIWYCHSDL